MLGNLGVIGLICFIIGIIIIKNKNFKMMFIYLFCTSILTTTTFISIGNNSITVPHISALLFFLMLLIQVFKKNINISFSGKKIYLYTVFSLISVVFNLVFKKNIINYELSLGTIIIQLIYLIISVIIFIGISTLISNEYITITTLNKTFKIVTLEISFLAFFQLINRDLFNMLFVNREGHAFIQTLANGDIRLTTAFNEPSMLAIFLSIGLIYFTYIGIQGKDKTKLYYTIPYLIIGILSRGSTFILALAICGLMILFILYQKVSMKKLCGLILLSSIGIYILNLFSNNILFEEILALFYKFLGRGVSGGERLNSFFYAMDIFQKNYLFGIGYGSIRTTDWLSTLLINTGIIGILILFSFFYSILLIRNKDDIFLRGLKISLIVTILLLLVSVPEPYFNFIWILLAFTSSSHIFYDTDIADRINTNRYKEKSMKHKEPLVEIILVNYNGAKDTIDCLNSLSKIDYNNYHIVVVDNNSSDNSVELLRKYTNERVCLLELTENIGFAGGNNVGIKYAINKDVDYLLLLNNDTEVESNFLNILVDTAESNDVIGAVGSQINYFYEKNKIWFLKGKINSFLGKTKHVALNELDEKLYRDIMETEYITGCLMLIKRDVIDNVGMMDENYFLYYEETDWCMKIKKYGYKLVINPNALIYHKVSSSTGKISDIVSYYYDRNSYYFIMNNYGFINRIFMYIYKRIYLIAKYIYFRIINNKEKCHYVKKAYKDITKGVMGKYNE